MYTSESNSKSEIILSNINKYQTSEDKIAECFVDDGWTASLNTSCDCSWDYRFTKDNVQITAEIKDESNYTSSPNLCIEGWQGNDKHPAGIMTTRADVGIHIFGSESAVYYNPEMKKWITNNAPLKIDKFKGADNNNGGWLVRKRDVIKEKWFGLFPTQFIPGCRIIQAIFRHRRNK